MVDAHALGAFGCGRAGSNPASLTMTMMRSRGAVSKTITCRREQRGDINSEI